MSPRLFFIIQLTICSLVLLVAYFIDYSGLSVPCKLCMYERFPYFMAIIIALIGINLGKNYRLCLYVLLIIYALNIGLSSFHVAVEQKWIEYSSGCTTYGLESNTIEEFKKKLDQKDLVSCDQSDLKVLGITLATWNLMISCVIFIIAAIYLKKK